MTRPRYSPERGDIIWLDFEPHAGREQGGRRPALVLSHGDYNRSVGLLVAVPVTRRAKGYPFELPLPDSVATEGVALCDHMGSKDWVGRKAAFIERAPEEFVDRVLARALRLLQ